ncbi:X-domain of DnaJ-containing-domain-containing protein [Tribonema minus]|uniref:X-domain of DnaJ-containing-domain-containing protein n=1 Tax=Tribonema minus TaxID=303371 RepID=A0A836CC89_9STRA|nr:X-domain of DnaJ-containing-domain-containing protein [Tribonema minus]
MAAFYSALFSLTVLRAEARPCAAGQAQNCCLSPSCSVQRQQRKVKMYSVRHGELSAEELARRDLGAAVIDHSFDTTKGVASGVGAVTKGAVSGAAAVVAVPVAGFRHGGIAGALLGAVGGVCAGAGLAAAGVAIGGVQVVRGLAQTPSTIAGVVMHKEWDEKSGRWIVYNLQEEAKIALPMDEAAYVEYRKKGGAGELAADDAARALAAARGEPSDAAAAAAAPAAPAAAVAETELYDALGVTPAATAEQVKMAYFVRTLRAPSAAEEGGSGGGGGGATADLQLLGEACQVLSDAELRKLYDARGRAGVADAPLMDGAAFHAMVFGNDKFEPLVGKLQATTQYATTKSDADPATATTQYATTKSDADPAAVRNAAQLAQWKREVQCALNLVVLLQPLTSGQLSEADFRKEMEVAAEALASTPMGQTYLSSIGYVYAFEAETELQGKMGMLRPFEWAGHALLARHRLTRAGVVAADRQATLAEKQKKGASSEEAEAALATKAAEATMETFWRVTVLDIEDTLRSVCRKVLRDNGVTQAERAARARALLITGKIFHARGDPAAVPSAAETDALAAALAAKLKTDGAALAREADVKALSC